MRPMFLVLLAGLVAGCGASPFFQTGDRVEGELTSDGGETGSLFVTLTLNRHRGELSPPRAGALFPRNGQGLADRGG